MATIVRRTSQDGHVTFLVRVRRKGAPPQTATFSKRSEAKKWAQVTEGAVLEGGTSRHPKPRSIPSLMSLLAIAVKCFLTRDLQRSPTKYDNYTGGKRILDITSLPISPQRW